MDRLRTRIADKRVLGLVKAFLKAGILGQDGTLRDSNTGVPQGGILSPVLANLALSVLDESIAQIPGGPGSTQGQRALRRHRGQGNYRLIRYADDWLLMVSGTREHTEQMREHAAAVLAPMGLRLSAEKTKITHIDKGLDFLGWHIQRHRKRGTSRYYVYTYPSRKAIKAVTGKVKAIVRRNISQPLQTLIRQLNPALRGWCAYFRPGVSAATFADLARYTLGRFLRWARRKHRRITVKTIRRRYCGGGWWPVTAEVTLFNPAQVRTTRYRYRGAAIPAPWPASG